MSKLFQMESIEDPSKLWKRHKLFRLGNRKVELSEQALVREGSISRALKLSIVRVTHFQG